MPKPGTRHEHGEDRFAYERRLRQQGVTVLAGVDEAGRGPLAGPVVAAAACLAQEWVEGGLPKALQGLNDSKQISPSRREDYFAALTTLPGVRFAIARVEAEQIDLINILRATHLAMQRALQQLAPPPQHVLVDGLPVPALPFPQTALVGGDGRSYSIAAASILAKVTRDRLMLDYHRRFPEYGFAEHKGYGTARHIEALARLGPCAIHRKSFAWGKPAQQELL